MNSQFTTSWSDYQLFQLSNIDNHSITPDGDGYYKWYYTIDATNHLATHKEFKSISHAKEFIHFNITRWNNELFNRKNTVIKSLKAKSTIQNKKHNMYNNIKDIKNKYPGLTHKRIAEHLGISISTVKRGLKN